MKGSLTLITDDPALIEGILDTIFPALKLIEAAPMTQQTLQEADEIYQFKFITTMNEVQFESKVQQLRKEFGLQLQYQFDNGSGLLRDKTEIVSLQESKKQVCEILQKIGNTAKQTDQRFISLDQHSDSDQDKFIELVPQNQDQQCVKEQILIIETDNYQTLLEFDVKVQDNQEDLKIISNQVPTLISKEPTEDEHLYNEEQTVQIDVGERFFKYFSGKDDQSTVFKVQNSDSQEIIDQPTQIQAQEKVQEEINLEIIEKTIQNLQKIQQIVQQQKKEIKNTPLQQNKQKLIIISKQKEQKQKQLTSKQEILANIIPQSQQQVKNTINAVIKKQTIKPKIKHSITKKVNISQIRDNISEKKQFDMRWLVIIGLTIVLLTIFL